MKATEKWPSMVSEGHFFMEILDVKER